MSPGAWPRPRVVVSACLGFAAVRYSGELIPDKVVAALKEHVDFVPVCPEVEIGLGVPRPVVRLVRGEEGPRMVQPKTGRTSRRGCGPSASASSRASGRWRASSSRTAPPPAP